MKTILYLADLLEMCQFKAKIYIVNISMYISTGDKIEKKLKKKVRRDTWKEKISNKGFHMFPI